MTGTSWQRYYVGGQTKFSHLQGRALLAAKDQKKRNPRRNFQHIKTLAAITNIEIPQKGGDDNNSDREEPFPGFADVGHPNQPSANNTEEFSEKTILKVSEIKELHDTPRDLEKRNKSYEIIPDSDVPLAIDKEIVVESGRNDPNSTGSGDNDLFHRIKKCDYLSIYADNNNENMEGDKVGCTHNSQYDTKLTSVTTTSTGMKTEIDEPKLVNFTDETKNKPVVDHGSDLDVNQERCPKGLLISIDGDEHEHLIELASSLTIGIGEDVDVNLPKFGHCNYISKTHAIVFYNKETFQFEVLNYSPYGTRVDNILLSLKKPDLTCENGFTAPENCSNTDSAKLMHNSSEGEGCSMCNLVIHKWWNFWQQPVKAMGATKFAMISILEASEVEVIVWHPHPPAQVNALGFSRPALCHPPTLPPFWTTDPVLWFIQVEAIFVTSCVCSQIDQPRRVSTTENSVIRRTAFLHKERLGGKRDAVLRTVVTQPHPFCLLVSDCQYVVDTGVSVSVRPSRKEGLQRDPYTL
ncbi:hypothetical protein AAG570_012941 [Ranatra chinensis]|uniref:FHA domain-containing protein n=1 Tax=Ranatra chinensis TaxID=642074 RepID=A0ABD0Z1J5_9HEMI